MAKRFHAEHTGGERRLLVEACHFLGRFQAVAGAAEKRKASPAFQPLQLLNIHRELVARNGITEGQVYLEISHGNPGDRDLLSSTEDGPPTVVLFTESVPNAVEARKVAPANWCCRRGRCSAPGRHCHIFE